MASLRKDKMSRKYTKKEYLKYCREIKASMKRQGINGKSISFGRWKELQPIADKVQKEIINKANSVLA